MRGKPIDLSNGTLICRICGKEKPISEFVKYSRSPSGVQKKCLECNRLEHYESYHSDLIRGRQEARKREQRKTKKQIKQKEQLTSGVYIIEMQGIFKIGMSINAKKRIQTILGSLPYQGKLIALIETGQEQTRELENELHDQFIEKRLNGEWFVLNQDDLQKIKNRYGI